MPSVQLTVAQMAIAKRHYQGGKDRLSKKKGLEKEKTMVEKYARAYNKKANWRNKGTDLGYKGAYVFSNKLT